MQLEMVMRDRDLAMAAIDAAQCKAPDISLSDLLTAAQPLGWVYEGGQEFTSDPDRAHDLRAEGIDLTAVYGLAQHQGEPVALPARKDTTQHWAEPGGVHKAEGWNAYHEELARLGPLYTHPAPFQQGEPVAFYREFVDGREYCEKPFTNDWTPLYTHAAAAGEVEQGYHNSVVEGLVSRQNELREERDTLRAEVDQFKLANARLSKENVDRRNQLAEREAALDALNEIATGYKRDLDERDALLRDINKRHSSGVDFDLPADLAARVAAVCATSAEPSAMGTDAGIPASVERDERAEFESWVETRKVCTHKCAKLHKDRAGSYLDYRINDRWLTWQARAALERKP